VARDEPQTDPGGSRPKPVRAGRPGPCPAHAGGLVREVIIETAAASRKRNACIACMRGANVRVAVGHGAGARRCDAAGRARRPRSGKL